MMALRTTLHATVAALILVSSHAISTALEALGTNSDGGFIPPAGVPNAQLEVQEQLKALGIPVYGLQIDLKSTRGPSLSPSPDKQLVKRTAHIGISPLRAIQFQAYYGIDVQVGGRTFRMLVDTGSSDLWLPSENITCVDGNFKEVPQSQCNFTQFTPPTYSGGQIPDRNFNITYAIGATFLGTAGYESVSIGGLTVKKQTVAKVKIAHREASPAGNWNGIFGLGFPNSTNVFPGLDPTKDNRTYPDPHNSIPYNPWVVSAFEDGVIEKPVFTLLLGPRGINDGEIAGSMIIGGAAPSHSVRYGGLCVSTKLRVYKPPYRNYFWDFVPDGMKIGDRFIPWEERTRYDDGMHAYDVDSGNDFTWLPNSTMDPWLSSFDPPSITDSRGSYAPCNATFASVAIRIGGKDIPFINSSLLLQPPYGAVNGTPGYCWTGIQPWGYTLGATFLSSVAATFDMTPGSERMVFSSLAK